MPDQRGPAEAQNDEPRYQAVAAVSPGSIKPLANAVDDVYVEPADLLRLQCRLSAAVSAGLTFEFLAGHA